MSDKKKSEKRNELIVILRVTIESLNSNEKPKAYELEFKTRADAEAMRNFVTTLQDGKEFIQIGPDKNGKTFLERVCEIKRVIFELFEVEVVSKEAVDAIENIKRRVKKLEDEKCQPCVPIAQPIVVEPWRPQPHIWPYTVVTYAVSDPPFWTYEWTPVKLQTSTNVTVSSDDIKTTITYI